MRIQPCVERGLGELVALQALGIHRLVGGIQSAQVAAGQQGVEGAVHRVLGPAKGGARKWSRISRA